MKLPFFTIFITYILIVSFSCNTNNPKESKNRDYKPEGNPTFLDSLDTDTSRNYIYSNVPANLHSETDSIFNIVKSIDNSVGLVAKVREKIIELEFYPISDDNHFSYLRRRFNRRTYVSIQDTLTRNKKIIINSYFWDNGKKYNNIIMYFTNPE